jgi:peptide/nickel transport system substrate-binding protein
MTRRHLARVAAAGALPLALLLSACGGGSSASTGTAARQDPNQLTIASDIAPNSLNPALGGSGDPQQYYFELAYDTLIHRAKDGTLQPGLATAWQWVGSGSRTLELTLRDGVVFSDGGALTAQGVKDSLQYYAKAGGPLANNLVSIASIDVLSDTKLRINLNKANPDLPIYLSISTTGDIISPNGLHNPGALGTSTAGSGQYVLDQAHTVSGQTYAYVPNSHYYDQSAIHWKKIVIKVIKDENATLAALKSGEIDYAMGDPSTAAAAGSAGFQVKTAPLSIMQLMILDRAGKLSQPLSKLQVRQAMMYGIDRAAVAKSLFSSYASGYDAAVLKGADGYSDQLVGRYSYDPAKAKQLLAQAGYASGFDLPIIVNLTGVGETKAAEAFAAEMANIGINVKITVPANTNELFSTYMKYPAMMFDYGTPILTAYGRSNDLLYSWGNPLNEDNSDLDALYNKAAGEDGAQAAADWQAYEVALEQQLYTIPMFTKERIFYARPGLAGIDLSATNVNPALSDLHP